MLLLLTLFLLSRFVIERESARKENNEQAKEERVMVGNLSLPGRVFPSREEEEVGLLNRAAPRYCSVADPVPFDPWIQDPE